MAVIYGVDTTNEVTPKMIREAIVSCFYDAHCKQSELGEEGEAAEDYCTEIVKRAFSETGGDFENPNKKSILACIPWLAEFSKSFRDQSVIQKHMSQIVELINLVKD